MSNYNLSLTFESILTITRMFLDILIIWLLLYYMIKIIRNNSRTSQIFKGILLVILIDMFAKFLGLTTVAYFADIFVNWGFLAIIIVFQPEIRSLLERLGKTNVFSRITTLSGNEKEHLVDQIVTATMLLSKDQTGALISIEQSHSLNDFIKTGTPINSIVTAELLTSIFVTSTPLHDGAVIIQGDRIACASAYFPPTNLEVPSRYGARHRAAIGISEITDAVTIVVSEETGSISIADSGQIVTVNRKQLRNYLLRIICDEETEVKANVNKVRVENSKDAYSLENNNIKTKSESDKRFDTAVLSKLAIKEHIKKLEEAETVVEIVDDKKPKKKKFKLFKKKEKVSKNKPELLNEEKNNEAYTFEIDEEKEKQAEFEKEARLKQELAEKEKQEAERLRQQAILKASQEAIERTRQEAAERERQQAIFKARQQAILKAKQEALEKEKELELEREASHIKLPKKKDRPVPSYPINEANVRVMGVDMVEKKNIPVLESVKNNEKQENIFDTTSININKLMGFDDELEDTFAMVDGFNVPKKKTTAAFTAVEEITPPQNKDKGGVNNDR